MRGKICTQRPCCIYESLSIRDLFPSFAGNFKRSLKAIKPDDISFGNILGNTLLEIVSRFEGSQRSSGSRWDQEGAGWPGVGAATPAGAQAQDRGFSAPFAPHSEIPAVRWTRRMPEGGALWVTLTNAWGQTMALRPWKSSSHTGTVRIFLAKMN